MSVSLFGALCVLVGALCVVVPLRAFDWIDEHRQRRRSRVIRDAELFNRPPFAAEQTVIDGGQLMAEHHIAAHLHEGVIASRLP